MALNADMTTSAGRCTLLRCNYRTGRSKQPRRKNARITSATFLQYVQGRTTIIISNTMLMLASIMALTSRIANRSSGVDQPRDQPDKYLYYARSFWLYLQGHCKLCNGGLVCGVCFMCVYCPCLV